MNISKIFKAATVAAGLGSLSACATQDLQQGLNIAQDVLDVTQGTVDAVDQAQNGQQLPQYVCYNQRLQVYHYSNYPCY